MKLQERAYSFILSAMEEQKAEKCRKIEPLKKAQNDKIENVASSVWLSRLVDGSGKCQLPSTPSTAGLSRIQQYFQLFKKRISQGKRLKVCVCVCVCICLSTQTYNFTWLHLFMLPSTMQFFWKTPIFKKLLKFNHWNTHFYSVWISITFISWSYNSVLIKTLTYTLLSVCVRFWH